MKRDAQEGVESVFIDIQVVPPRGEAIMDAPRGLDPVTAVMAGMGLRLVDSEQGTMDSGSARYSDVAGEVNVWKDRSQWFIGDERAVLEPMGFFRAFDDIAEFCEALARYVRERRG